MADPPNKPTSSASAGLLLAQGTKSASSISIRWTLAWQMPQTSEHHRHQLGCFLHRRTASWTFAWLVHQASEHHQHQLDSRLGRCPKQANISAGLLLRQIHQHQADSRLAGALNKQTSASAGPASCTKAPNQPASASSASAGLLLAQGHQISQHYQHQLDFGVPQTSEHHQHQLGCFLHIISISWTLAWQVHQTSEHHQHQLGWFLSLGRGTKQASIISISAVLHRSTTSASIISIRWTKQVISSCASSSPLAGAPQQRASSASAGHRLAQGHEMSQHHQHQVDQTSASIIGVLEFQELQAPSIRTATRAKQLRFGSFGSGAKIRELLTRKRLSLGNLQAPSPFWRGGAAQTCPLKVR